MNNRSVKARVPARALALAASASALMLACAFTGCGSDDAHQFGGGTGGQSPADGGPNDASGSGGATGGHTGSGGVVGTGGRIGSGGTAGATSGGGTSGAGGRTATGGKSGAGGRAATGGTTGTGGAGAGGRTGSGGISGAGGVTGAGGAGGSLAASCDALAAAYQQALPGAKVCSNALDRLPCSLAVPTRLDCPGNCITYVDSTTSLDPIQQQWTALGCASVPRACLLIACLPVSGATCVVATGAIMGTCQNTSGVITTANSP